jgi:uncharacterized membrane protein (DUF2068 family)
VRGPRLGRLAGTAACRNDAILTESLNPLSQRLGVLRLIAVFKLGKALLVIGTGLSLLQFYEPRFAAGLYRLVGQLPYDFEQRLMREAIAVLSGMSPDRIHVFAIATLAYSSLFLVEAVGLWLGRHWAEILTVVATSLLIPLEIYEVLKRYTPGKLLVFVANVLIVAYLIRRLRREADARRAHALALRRSAG